MRRVIPAVFPPRTVSRRHSAQAHQWTARLRYGFGAAPALGSPGGDGAAQALYCKALLHASGGGRLARDWLAGWTSVVSTSSGLLEIALQHESSAEDVERFRAHLAERIAAQCTGEELQRELGASQEVRCFVYDAMTAVCFHRSKKVTEEDRRRVFAVAEQLGLDEETTLGIWYIVEKEGILARKKQLTLDHPWSS